MTFGSVCSGIEAASVAWHPMGWQCAFTAEIEHFPCAVLEQRWPDSPNLGDINEYKSWPDHSIDILVGGTPCQDFSIAGQRAGMAGSRGGLTMRFLDIARRYKPRFVVWENVPGILSDHTEALHSFLDGLEALGYIVDVEILDAQFFGLAQRRRRVFVCAQSLEALLRQKTDSSALTIAQCWLEILHAVCIAGHNRFASVRASSASASLTADGARRRMKLFGMLADESQWMRLLEHLDAAQARCPVEPGCSDSQNGASQAGGTQAGLLTDLPTANQSTATGARWKNHLAESYAVAKSFITSTSSKTITPLEIFTCSQAVLHIARLISQLNPSLPPFWSAASSALAGLQDFTNYARFANSDLFERVGWILPWHDFIGEAERTNGALGGVGIECFGTVLPLSASMRGNPPPRREPREKIAPTIGSRLKGGGGLGTDAECDGALIAHTFTSEGHDASEDGTGRRVPLVAMTANSISNRYDAESQTLVPNRAGVRRLTPTEVERLFGFPDGYTAIPWRGKPAGKCPDSPRYRALGNSMAVTIMQWIGRRITLANEQSAHHCLP